MKDSDLILGRDKHMTFAWKCQRLFRVLPYQDFAIGRNGEEIVQTLHLEILVIVPNDFGYWFSMEILVGCRATDFLLMFGLIQIPNVNLTINGSSSEYKRILWMKLNVGATIVRLYGLIGLFRF